MQKRIVAICLVVLMLTTLLASCGKKYLMVEINGTKRPLVTDAEGNTKISDDGKLAIYVTDAKGNLALDEEGNTQVEYFQLPDKIVEDHHVQTDEYVLTLPNEWKLSDNGIFYKKGTNDKCYINCLIDRKLGEDETYHSFITEKEKEQRKYAEDFKSINLDSTVNVVTDTLPAGQKITYFEYKVIDETGKMIHYAISAYVLIEDSVYSVNYVCADGVGYDEAFDFQATLNEGFVIKK